MADLAIGRPCPRCGTLTVASGAFDDEELTGSCPNCGQSVAIVGHEVKDGKLIGNTGRVKTEVSAPAPEPVAEEEPQPETEEEAPSIAPASEPEDDGA